MKKGTAPEGSFYYDYHKREQSPSWLLKHIETLIEESEKHSNSSFVLYGALEMRNLLEKIAYDLMLMSSNKEQWEDIKNSAKGKQGIKRSNEKYKSLKFKYQTFSEAIGKVADLPVRSFDSKNANIIEEELGEYIHTYTLDKVQIEYSSKFIQNGIEKIQEGLKFVKSYFIKKDKSNVFGVLNFDSLNEEYRKAFEEWKQSPSQSQEDIDAVVRELNKKDPIK